MSRRRDNRVAAVQFLYMWDLNRPADLNSEIRRFFESLAKGNSGDEVVDAKPQGREYYAFGEELVRGALKELDEVDPVIRKHATNWDFHRIAKIDLAILRLAIYEMSFRDDIPPVVTINEAIELSKMFSIDESKRFINGILDQHKLSLGRPDRKPRP